VVEVASVSLSAAPDRGSLRITEGARRFLREDPSRTPGTRVVAEGRSAIQPKRFAAGRRSLLIAGGIASPPIRALLEAMNGDVIVLYRVMRDDDIIFATSSKSCERSGIDIRFVAATTKPRKVAIFFPPGTSRSWFRTSPSASLRLRTTRNDECHSANVRDADVPARFIHAERFALWRKE